MVIKEVQDKFFEILERRIGEYKAISLAQDSNAQEFAADFTDLMNFLLSLKHAYRFYRLSDPDGLQDLWADIREKEDVLDLMLSTMVEIKLFVEDLDFITLKNETKFQRFVKTIASSLCAHTEIDSIKSSTGSVIDEDTFQRIPRNENDVINLYQENPWVVFVFLLNTISLPWREVSNDVTRTGTRRSR